MNGLEPEVSSFRSVTGPLRFLIKVLLIAIPGVGVFFIMDTPSYLGWPILREQYFGVFLAIALPCVFLVVPPTKGAVRNRVPWYDVILSILGFAVGLYVAVLYPNILLRMGTITSDRVVMGTIAIVLLLEGVRRFIGWFLPCFCLLLILYARFTWVAPGILGGSGIPWERLINYLYLDINAVLGAPLAVTAVIVLSFILFGNMMFGAGGGVVLNNLALAAFGRFRGGPAKMAVVASALFGTMSGSAVANVCATGVVTIPLMKKTGIKPHVAGGIEAVASTGGQLMPPVMGAAAFLIPEYTNIPYWQVALSALLPSVLYYLALFIQIDLEAGKVGLKGLPREQLPAFGEVLKQSYLFIIPLAALVYALFILFLEPGKAALLGGASVFLVSFFRRETRFHFGWFLEALEKTGRGLLELTVIVALAGVIIGAIVSSGLSFIIPIFMGKWAGGNVFLLLGIIAVTGIILGMGMPTVAVYIFLALMLSPILIQLGIDILAAHLFVLYYGIIAMITPPVCFASFAAAAIAGANPMRTGWASMRLGFLIYIVPFLFVFSPALMLRGPIYNTIVDMLTAMAGCFLVGCALVGYLFRKLTIQMRALMGLAGLGLLIPHSSQFFVFGFLSNILGGSLAILLLLWEWRVRKQRIVGEGV